MTEQVEAPAVQAGVEVLPGYKPELQKLPPKKIGVLGTCPSRVLAPVRDLSWNIWTIGPGGKNANRWERLFEIHGADSWPEGFLEYMQELKEVKPPRVIYTEDPVPDWPANVIIPKDDLFAKYGRMWFGSSISYAMAIALEENVTDLGLFGIDLESDEEKRVQFMGAKHFIDLARLAGVNVHLPAGCGLLRDPNPYPNSWETALAMLLQSKIDYLRAITGEKRHQHAVLGAEINHLDGECAMAEFIKSRFVVHGDIPEAKPAKPKLTAEGKLDRLLMLLKNGQLDQLLAAQAVGHNVHPERKV